jgi:hypothetical protein
VGSLVVKGVMGEFFNIGTGGNISRGDHLIQVNEVQG